MSFEVPVPGNNSIGSVKFFKLDQNDTLIDQMQGLVAFTFDQEPPVPGVFLRSDQLGNGAMEILMRSASQIFGEIYSANESLNDQGHTCVLAVGCSEEEEVNYGFEVSSASLRRFEEMTESTDLCFVAIKSNYFFFAMKFEASTGHVLTKEIELFM